MDKDSEQKAPAKDMAGQESIGSVVGRFRSFEADLAKLKGVPLPEKKKVEQKPTEPAPSPFSIAGKNENEVISYDKTYETLQAANFTPAPKPKEDPAKAVEALHKGSPLQSIRTISNDIAEKKTSVEQIILAEREKNRPRSTIDPKRSIFSILLSIILLAGGLLAIGFWYLTENNQQNPPPAIVNIKQIIPAESIKKISLASGESVASAIQTASNQQPSQSNKIVQLVFYDNTGSQLNGTDFSSLLSPSAPDWFNRSIDSDFFAGIYNAPEEGQPLFIFKVNSFESAYAGMLKWEQTMYEDLGFANAKVASTSPEWSDAIIKNKDVRVLKDSFGKDLILYSFTDKQTLLIAIGQEAFDEAVARLTTSNFVR